MAKFLTKEERAVLSRLARKVWKRRGLSQSPRAVYLRKYRAAKRGFDA